MWGFGNRKNKRNNEKEQEKNAYPEIITVEADKCYHLLGARVIKKHDNLETYVAKVYITDRTDDTILFDFPSPIAFELPENRPDLIEALIASYDKAKSGRMLSDVSYTYIGNIKSSSDGKLYYYNEPPSKEVADAIDIEEKAFIKEYNEIIKLRQEERIRSEKARREAEFKRGLEIDKSIEENRRYQMQKRNDRLKIPYFKREDGFGTEGYDAINLNDGNIMLIRNMQKFKDSTGRYLYTAFVRQVNEDSYTEYNSPIGNQVAFTTPGRLSDIVADQNNQQIVVKAIQKMLSNACSFIDEKEPKGLIDIGGVLNDGRIVQNSERNGISSAITSKIKSLGAKSMEDMSLNR